MTDRYIELHANSAFSFLEGGSQPEKLVERAFELGMSALAMMDRNGFYGSARFHKTASENGIKAHVGAEVSVTGLGNRLTPPIWLPHQHLSEPTRLSLLCETREGYQNLSQLITRFKLRETTKQEGAAKLADLEEYSRGLVCLTGDEEGPLAAALMKDGEVAGRAVVERLVRVFGQSNVYVEVQRHRERTQEWRNQAAMRIAESLRLPVLATNGVRYATRYDREVAELHSLRANVGDFQIALDSYRAAMADFLEAKRYDNAIVMAQRIADLLVQRFLREGDLSSLREAERTLLRAIEWIEIIWARVNSVQWRFEVSNRYSNVYAELAWCQATLGAAPEIVAFALARSKGREFISHSAESRRSLQLEGGLGEFMDQLRVESREAERARWEAARKSRFDVDVNVAVQASRQSLRDIELRRGLLFPPPTEDVDQPPLDSVDAFLAIQPASLILDLTVSRWGTIALRVGGRDTGTLAGYSMQVLPIASTTARAWVEQWSSAYFEYLNSPTWEKDEARVILAL
jgi:HEPN domain-containing protein